ncbi:MAG: aminoacyl-histidine dipeptidase [Prevotellaceae bacterium]|jgi:dipeptidase D|nr:aminoacyl-histidine dipeptidase [Prevotellaceae bacterium]
MNSITGLKPQELWGYFYALTQIPRPSKKEEKVIEFIYNFGKNLGLETFKDDIGNVVIRKPAALGCEHKPGIILQTHLDMVPQKNSDKVHDFEKDPITALIDGDWVTADGTTLGADNGIGVAATMAVLASKTIRHGEIEGLFTIDEETGMTGAQSLKPGLLKGSILINLDSEDEGELYVGCAGGIDGNFVFDYDDETAPENSETFRISVTVLRGGHSGMDIHLGRGNSNKIMFRILKNLDSELRISSIAGGSVRNAIPRETFATVVVPAGKAAMLADEIRKIANTVANELQYADPDVKVCCEQIEPAKSVLPKNIQTNLINAITACPNGVLVMSQTIPGLVETSTNLAIVKSEKGKTHVACLIRSSVDSAKAYLASMEESVFTLAGAKSSFTGSYPGWNPNPNSQILSQMKEIYHKLYGRIPEVKAIHAGLECGLLGGIYPEWDMISCGPTIRFPHSPDEKVNIASVEKWWTFLIAVLENQQ